MTDQQKKTIIDMRQRGAKYPDIAKTTGLKVGTIRSFVSRLGLPHEETLFCRQCCAPLVPGRVKRNRVFCSTVCRMAWWNAHRTMNGNRKIHLLECGYCHAQFRSYEDAKFCSRACYFAARRSGSDGCA